MRAQVSHLRRKLEQYFDTEGRDEPLVLTIPKGNYLPVFTPVVARASLPVIAEHTQGETADALAEGTHSASVQTQPALPWGRKWKVGIAVLFSAAFLVLALLFLGDQHSRRPEDRNMPPTNPFVQFLARSQGDVTVVMPDTSLVMIQHIVGTNIPLSDYINNDFPQRQMAMVKDPTMRGVILDLGNLRTTSVNEALIASDFLKTLQGVGVHAAIRYARDIHVHDLSEGNTILIGGPTSDPWVSLFVNQMNFRQVDDPTLRANNYFQNLHPASGEQSQYMNTYPDLSIGHEANQSAGYVDITLTQNPSQSGYVLLIGGADLQANEAASRFLLHGKFPPEISSVLSRKDLRYFELLLHGKHMAGEADDSFELVAFRPK